MGLNVTNYVLQMKGDKSIASGFDHATRTGDNTFSIYFIDGSKVDLTIPLPSDGQDGISVTGVNDLGNGKFTLLFSDGSESDPIQTVKGQKGDKLTFNDLTDEEKASLKGDSGFSPTITENAGNTDKIYKLDITTADSTFTTPNLKGADGQGGTGGSGEENKIDSISVNGVNVSPDENKNVDITVPDAYDDTDIRTELAKKADTDHTHTTVNGHTVESDVPVDAKFTDTVYDDTQVKTQIQAVANGLMDSVGYSADYKTIDIIAKNGVKKSVNVAPIISHASITELSDVDTTNKATGKALVYNATTSKHEYADVSGTDEKVKMDSSTDAKYLGELLDNVTIANENGKLKVKKLDGQEVTITEINYLKGLTMNVMDLVNMFSNGGVKIINTPVATYAELLTLDKSSFIEGISYLVYVLADENHDNAKTTYLVDKVSETPTYFGFADSQRDFTTNPIDLATEITGKLGIANMDSDAIKTLFTVDDTYKTETATNNAFSTHGAKALYDELLLAIGNKANSSDLTAHKDDTDIHVSTEDRTKWDSAKTHADSAHAPSTAQANVIETVKVNGTALTPSSKAVNVIVPTTVAQLTDSSSYAKTANIPTTLPANGGNSDTVNNHTVESDVPTDAKFTDTIYDDTAVKESIEELNSNLDTLEFGEVAGGKNLLDIEEKIYSNSVTDEKTSFIATLKVNNTWAGAVNVTGNGIFSITFDITDSNINNIKLYHSGSHVDITLIYKDIYLDVGKYTMSFDAIGCNPQVVNGIKIQKIQIEKGTTATEYEPYIPSIKMIAEEVGKQNESLDTLEYGETAGGKNLFKGNFIEKVLDTGINYTDVDLSKEQNTIKDIKGITFAVFGAYLKKGTYTFSYTNDAYFSLNRVAIAGTDCILAIETIRKSYTWTQNTDGWTYFGIEGDDSETGVTDTPFSITPDIQIEEGTQATAYEPYIPSVKMLAEEVSAQNKSLSDLENAINGLNDDNYWEQGTWNILGQKVDEPTIIRMKEKLILPIDYSVSLVNSNYVYEVDYYENGAYKNDTDWISGSIVIPNGQEFALLIRKVDNSSLVPTERNAISVLPKNIGTINDKLKNDLVPKKIELQNVDERVTIQDNGSFIINGFAFVNLLVTFNETLPQWSNFVRLPRPKGGNVSVYCENSVRLTIYSQDNLPGDCGTYDIVQSGTEIRLLVNYEVA